jgi:hypothetical protein
MGRTPWQCVRVGRKLEKQITKEFISQGFDAEQVGGSWDNGKDVNVRLFGTIQSVQCRDYGPKTFSFSKLADALSRSPVGAFRIKEFDHPLIFIEMPVWMDHLTWERPGEDHARRKLRAFLAYKGLNSQDIEEACNLI